MKAEHLKPLTAIRFFAALWVVLYAYWPKLSATSPALVARGYLGVELFFVLSGFILCHVYLPQAEAGGFHYGRFIWARLARIYPLHLFTLIGIGIMGLGALAAGLTLTHQVLVWEDLPAQLLLTHAWGMAKVAGWNHASWSISAEWFAYLSFPAFAWLAMRARKAPGVAVAASLAFMAVLYAGYQALAGQSLTHATFAWGALRIVPCFTYGCALYLLWRSGAVQGRNLTLAGAILSLFCMLGAAILDAPDAITVALAGALILFLAGLASNGSRLLSHPALIWLGEVSYAVYMVFIPWELLYGGVMGKLLGIDADQMPVIVWLGFLAGVLPSAAIAHHLVEKPARELMRKWVPGASVRGLKTTAV
jgi:peptidoglycan/LPS O-acetylase OafA/YrhL